MAQAFLWKISFPVKDRLFYDGSFVPARCVAFRELVGNTAARALQGYRIWPVLPSASGNSSLRAGFGAAIQGRMDQHGDVRPWVATSQ